MSGSPPRIFLHLHWKELAEKEIQTLGGEEWSGKKPRRFAGANPPLMALIARSPLLGRALASP